MGEVDGAMGVDRHSAAVAVDGDLPFVDDGGITERFYVVAYGEDKLGSYEVFVGEFEGGAVGHLKRYGLCLTHRVG